MNCVKTISRQLQRASCPHFLLPLPRLLTLAKYALLLLQRLFHC